MDPSQPSPYRAGVETLLWVRYRAWSGRRCWTWGVGRIDANAIESVGDVRFDQVYRAKVGIGVSTNSPSRQSRWRADSWEPRRYRSGQSSMGAMKAVRCSLDDLDGKSDKLPGGAVIAHLDRCCCHHVGRGTAVRKEHRRTIARRTTKSTYLHLPLSVRAQRSLDR